MRHVRQTLSRLRAVLFMDTDVVFDAWLRRRRRRFREHPVLMHVIDVGVPAGMLTAEGIWLGWKFVLELAGVLGVVWIGFTAAIVLRVRGRRRVSR
jgi:hypothetical protein